MKKYLAGLPANGQLEILEGTPVGAMLEQLGVPPGLKRVVLVNSRHRSGDYLLPS